MQQLVDQSRDVLDDPVRFATLAVGFRSAAKQIAVSRSGYGMLALRGIEVGAAVVVLAFGALLLAGYMVAERGACF